MESYKFIVIGELVADLRDIKRIWRDNNNIVTVMCDDGMVYSAGHLNDENFKRLTEHLAGVIHDRLRHTS